MNLQLLDRENQRKMLEAIINTQEREKQYFAGELHDGLGQLLSTVFMNLNNIEKKIETSEDTRLGQLIKDTKSITQDSINEVRNLSRKLMPEVLSDFGLKQAISDMAGKVNESGNMIVRFYCDSTKRFSEEIEKSVFRISQELLNNTIKNAEASIVFMTIQQKGSELIFIYEDDGIGMDITESKGKGMGLISVESRVSYLRGSINFESEKNKGIKFTINIPMI